MCFGPFVRIVIFCRRPWAIWQHQFGKLWDALRGILRAVFSKFLGIVLGRILGKALEIILRDVLEITWLAVAPGVITPGVIHCVGN